MHAFDQNDQLCEGSAQSQGDRMDVTAHYTPRYNRPPLWSLPGFRNPGTGVHSPTSVPSPSLESSSSMTHPATDQPANVIEQPAHTQRPSPKRGSLDNFIQQPPESTAKHSDGTYERLEAEIVELAQALLQKENSLQAANKSIRDLAAWTLRERTRLMTTALQQRPLREDYEGMLRRRDEQVVHLLALLQESKLDHARTLVREGAFIGRPASKESVQRVNQMRTKVGLPPINQDGALEAVTAVSAADDAVTQDLGMILNNHQYATAWNGVYGDTLGNNRRESQPTEDEEGAYSPPAFLRATSVLGQVDEMIAEEQGRLANAWV
ncbi:hypothetical protein C7974DRAFT_416606 [Boeremia exigua]|uniref:uncharacterized protein n=1 Tax=Boeremia exigua TaxID=749465 RepID=UPI001E8E0D3F|nr:uncharacterized protein C7974DRAFT_416606 [Boeremia exigua]KAH6616477.1 hypothetical protein C7974DRAFT_416606 [Boeremia exigua]